MNFWDVFWLLLIFIPLLLIWAFAIVDIFRRDDLTGWEKALWVIVVFLLPFFGTLIYLILRRPGATPEERYAMDQASRDFVQRYAPSDTAQQLAVLSDLHDRGKLTDAEFTAEKTRVMARTSSPDTPPVAGSSPGAPATPTSAPTSTRPGEPA